MCLITAGPISKLVHTFGPHDAFYKNSETIIVNRTKRKTQMSVQGHDSSLVTDSTRPIFYRLYVHLVNDIVHLVRNGNL